MSFFVIGDIHGYDDAFRKALKSVSLKKSDTLLLLGDLIDRGPKSKDVLDTLMLLKDNGFNNIICLKGNHEEMLLKAIDNENEEYIWLKNGGDKTLKSFKVNFADKIPKKYIELIKSFKYYHIENEFIFVHAGLNLKIETPFDDTDSMIWIRNMDIKDLENSKLKNKVIIHGHTPKTKDDILNSININSSIICLDNGVFLEKEGYGKLIVFDMGTKKTKFIK